MRTEGLDDVDLQPAHRLIVLVEDGGAVGSLDIQQRPRIAAENTVAGAAADAFERARSKWRAGRGTERESDGIVVPRRCDGARLGHSGLADRDAGGGRGAQITPGARPGADPGPRKDRPSERI